MNYTENIYKIASQIKMFENKKKEIYDNLEKENNVANKQFLYQKLYVINLNIQDLQEQMLYLLDSW